MGLSSWKPRRANSQYIWDQADGMRCNFQRDSAISQYEAQHAPSYYILPNDFGLTHKSVYVTQTKPTELEEIDDFYVFPKNFAWCMAFTHEDGWIGPLFCKHQNYDKLHKDNMRALENIEKASKTGRHIT